MQFKLLKKQWDEMIKDKEEKKEIEKIFKNWYLGLVDLLTFIMTDFNN
jgi:hypothetical protein